jgi:CheY-like chemotaxis protein
MSKLFKAFSQVDNSSTKKYDGTGLGLVICKSLVKMMNGSISVRSEKGVGTVFQFNIMLKKDSSPESFPSEQLSQVNALSSHKFIDHSVRILLAEDNEINALLFENLLQMQGLSCDLVVNGEEALLAYERNNYDIIFMDCQMPVMNGCEATKKIRSIEGNQKHTIIIALTAYAMEEDKSECLMSGMDEYLNKPILIDQLQKILQKYITNAPAS